MSNQELNIENMLLENTKKLKKSKRISGACCLALGMIVGLFSLNMGPQILGIALSKILSVVVGIILVRIVLVEMKKISKLQQTVRELNREVKKEPNV